MDGKKNSWRKYMRYNISGAQHILYNSFSWIDQFLGCISCVYLICSDILWLDHAKITEESATCGYQFRRDSITCSRYNYKYTISLLEIYIRDTCLMASRFYSPKIMASRFVKNWVED